MSRRTDGIEETGTPAYPWIARCLIMDQVRRGFNRCGGAGVGWESAPEHVERKGEVQEYIYL